MIENEYQFQSVVLAEIRRRFGEDVLILEGTHRDLDGRVFLASEQDSWIRLLEFKVFKSSAGRVGFGGQTGEGTQVDLLLNDSTVLERFTQNTVRWVFANLALPEDSVRYALLTSCEAKQTAAGGRVSRGKQNNFNPNRVFANAIPWSLLIDQLGEFLSRPPRP